MRLATIHHEGQEQPVVVRGDEVSLFRYMIYTPAYGSCNMQ
ncbi:MAG: hypothetical protein ACI33P_15600 [Lysinibacillus sp.]